MSRLSSYLNVFVNEGFFWGEMFVGLVARATWRSPIQASVSKRYNIKHYNTGNFFFWVKRGWHNTSNAIRYKTMEHKHWGPKRLTQRPISDEWEKTQSGTVGVCVSRRTVRLKKEKGLYTDLCAEKKICTKMMTYEIVLRFYVSVSLFTPNESGYTIILLIPGLRLIT